MKLPTASFPWAKPPWPTSVPRPLPERHIGVDYDHDWSRRYPVRLARAAILDNVTKPAARLVAPTTVRGDEHLRHVTSPVIFAANHLSHLDTPILLTTLPLRFRHRTVVAAAADYFFDRRWKAVLWSFSLAAIPIERNRVNRSSVDVAASLLEDGWNLVIFPEGGRSPDGWAQPFHPASAAYLSRRTGCAVVPVHVHGTRDVLPKSDGGRRPIRRAPVSVVFGPPIVPEDDENARRLAVRIERGVAVLADEVGSDWWTARRRAAAGETPSLRGPDVSAWRRSWALGGPAAGGRAAWPRTEPRLPHP
jgi:1-acyl-sn-glycerol-3-phosphate acyltransferase